MQQRGKFGALAPLFLLLTHCGGDEPGPSSPSRAQIEMRVATPSTAALSLQKFKPGAAAASQLESLKYQVSSIMICEGLETNGSGFNNPTGCLELYKSPLPPPSYGLSDDWTPLANAARTSDQGYVDLLSATSRSQLAGSTVLTHEHARSYHYGVINWALPIKLKATVGMNDGSRLYTHDGVSKFETIGVDNFQSYFTEASTSLSQAPAEEAVVLLGNGGNWFKFQSPFTITAADIDEQRAFVLDLVFNPDGIVKGYSDSWAQGNLSERNASGQHLHDITVPMLDLAPVPHRASEQVMRESYQGLVRLSDNAFDVRIELYYVEGDTTGTVYGVDVKTLVNADTVNVPPELSKVSFLDRAADGTLSFSSFRHTPVMTGFRRVEGSAGETHVGLVCATHADRTAAAGGAAIVLERCPSPVIDLTLALTARSAVNGAVPVAIGAGPDAGADASVATGLDGGVLDAGAR